MDKSLGLLSHSRMRWWSTADAALAGLVVAVVALMIVPLPTWLLDILLATNLAGSVAVLLVALYVGDALKVAAFPTLLLITTLIRLGLNVSSTRLILLQANAGKVIDAFGQFVVRGNYVVGAIVFLILALIQFIVIAKGSERVAEVGARFTLDAMPGKQLAIDAELRSGTLNPQQAQQRRRTLARESQFYGAMDGAMKFVKGDVIASFLITTINILGGLTIGIGQRDMELAAALKRYGLLTIGDGLVTQIPALVIATAAGVLVTRVASEEQDHSLGQELAVQLLGQPRALRVAAVFVVVLALVPGLPAFPFLFIGLLLLAASYATRHARSARQADDPGGLRGWDEDETRFTPMVVPWALQLSPDLSRVRSPGLRDAVAGLRQKIFGELGVILPKCKIEVRHDLPERTLIVAAHEVPLARWTVPAEVADAQLVEHAMAMTAPLIRGHAARFLDLAETQELLDRLERLAPGLVRQVVPKPIGLATLTEVLKRLVAEQVSIRDLRGILQALARAGKDEQDPVVLAEAVRTDQRDAISHALAGGAKELKAVLLSPHIENTIRDAIAVSPTGKYLGLAPAASRDIVDSIRQALASAEFGNAPRIVLTQPDIRHFVRKLLAGASDSVRVVAVSELAPELNIVPAAHATLQGV